jgi:hypothetical protein
MPADSAVGSIERLGQQLVRVLGSCGLLARILHHVQPLVALLVGLESQDIRASRVIRGNHLHTVLFSLLLLGLVTSTVDGPLQRAPFLIKVINSVVVCLVHGHQVIHLEVLAEGTFFGNTPFLKRVFGSGHVGKLPLVLLLGLSALLHRLNQGILVGVRKCLRKNFEKFFDNGLHSLLLRIVHRIT